MEQRQKDKIREKLYDLETPVGPEVWQGIEGSLRRKRFRRLFTYASSAAAVLVAALLVLWPVEKAPEEAVQQIAQAVQVQNNLPDSDAQADDEIQEAALAAEEDAEQITARQITKEIKATAAAREEAGRMKGKAIGQVNVADAAQGNFAGENIQVKAADIAQVKEDVEDEKEAEENGAQVIEKVAVASPQGYEGYLAALEAEEEEEGKKYSIAFSSSVIPGSSASVSGSTIKASSAGAGAISHSYNIEQISDTRYSLPLNLGIQFQFALKENLAVGVGVNYTLLRSRYDCLINKKQFEVTQMLHYVGVPVNVYGLISERNRFSFYVNAGAMFEKGIRAVYDLKSYNQKEHSSSSISGVDFSVNAGLGVEYRPGNLVGLYFEPNLVYFINSDVPRSIRTDQPLQVKAELGCRFHF